MVLAILAFAFEMLIIFLTLGGGMTMGLAQFALGVYIVCPLISLITLFTNINGIRHAYFGKGKYITGLVFSCIALFYGLTFWLGYFGILVV